MRQDVSGSRRSIHRIMSQPNYSQITCKVCNTPGAVGRAKVRRMSGPAVAIGYIFLIPSVLGMLLGVILLFGTGGAASEVASRNDQDYAVALQSVEGLTQEQVQAIGALEAPDADQLEELGLSAEQERAVLDADLLRSAGQVGAGAGAAIGGAMSFVLILFSFVGGLIGWLLTMKKTVLLCKNCRGVHAEAT